MKEKLINLANKYHLEYYIQENDTHYSFDQGSWNTLTIDTSDKDIWIYLNDTLHIISDDTSEEDFLSAIENFFKVLLLLDDINKITK